MIEKDTLLRCEKCGKVLKAIEFYGSNNTEKYPDGKLRQCKACLTMHVDNWDPTTYHWILEEVDVPYIQEEWNKILQKELSEGKKITTMTIIGKYLAKMKLKQFKDYRWKDTNLLREMAEARAAEAMRLQGYAQAEIDQALATGIVQAPERPTMFAETDLPPAPEIDEFENDLTEEDRTYLRLKWGKSYRAEEWVTLEQLYEEMLQSYDIQAAGDLNTLKLACKCSLKANQLLDIGDVDGAQKATKMYDSLMKSGKWTAAQNKTDENELIDSVGELVALCERDGFIPRYYSATPKDHVDRVIEDLKKYTTDLVREETGLSSMIEMAMRQMEDEKAKIEAAAELGEDTEEEVENKMFNYDAEVVPVSAADYEEFNDFQEGLEDEDYDNLLELLDKAGEV